MLDKIEAIMEALKKECFLPALALALTIPDICGKVEYPDLYTGRRYIEWFDKHARSYFSFSNSTTSWINNSKLQNSYFTGEMCYKLRCAFLHSGNEQIPSDTMGEVKDDAWEYEYKFRLSLDRTSVGETWDNTKTSKRRTITIDVRELCKAICYAAQEYYDEVNDPEKFAPSNCNIEIIPDAIKKWGIPFR